MDDQKPTSTPAPDIEKDVSTDPILASEPTPRPEPAFHSEAFLTDKHVETNRAETKRSVPPLSVPPAFVRPPSSAAPVMKRGGIGFFTALLMSLLAAGGGAYLALFAGSRPDLLQKAGLDGFIPAPPKLPSLGTDATNITPLVARVSAVEAELLSIKTRLDGRTPSTPPPTLGTGTASPPPLAAPATGQSLGDMGPLKSELQGISGRVTAIETRLAALDPTGAGGAVIAGLQADIASLKAIIGALQQQAAAAPSPAVTFAVVNLAEAANRTGPFMIEYETLRTAMPGVPEVAALESFARAGVPTRAILQERFSDLAPAITAAEEAANKGTGILAWFRGLFSGMVKVQSASDANGTGNGAILARAKIKLDQGDLSGSIADVASLSTPPTLVTSWVSDARKRLELESRVSAVRGALGRAVISPTGPAIATTSASTLPTATVPTAKTQGTNR